MEEVKTYGFDDLITDDGASDFGSTPVLDEGDYTFTVVKAEKGHYDGSDKIPPCKMITVYMSIDGGEHGRGFSSERFYLCDKCVWKAASFLRAIGKKKHGEDVSWRKIADATSEDSGRCHVTVREYNGKKSNEINKYYDKSEAKAEKTFVPGDF